MSGELELDPGKPEGPTGWDQIADRFWRGDGDALGMLLEKEMPHLRRVLKEQAPKRLRHRLRLSDLVQETAIILAARRPRFENRGPGALRRLLRTIARRVLRGAVRREQAQKRAPDAVGQRLDAAARWLADSASTASKRLLRKELLDGMRACCARLGEDERRIIQLVDYQELDLKEAARTLGLSHAAARKRHSRAVARLRQLMRDAGLLGGSAG
jgi:RNA polymerase sigma-70 factor (ECF subfamily)